MAYDTQYYWVVLCKNHRFHKKQNIFFGHTIPLGETDSFVPPPSFDGKLKVRCDNCGEEYLYEPKDILRTELEPPARFVPHPLFA